MCPLLQRSAEASGPSSPECTPTGPQGRGSKAQRREHRVRSLPSCGRGHAPSDRSPWPSKTIHVPPQPVPIIGVSVRWDLEFGCRAVTEERSSRGQGPTAGSLGAHPHCHSLSLPSTHSHTHSTLTHTYSYTTLKYAHSCSLIHTLTHAHTHMHTHTQCMHTCSHLHTRTQGLRSHSNPVTLLGFDTQR